jgi:hypothetical protein
MEVVNDMLLIIDMSVNYLDIIDDIYFKKWLKAMDFVYKPSLELDWYTWRDKTQWI